MSSDFNNVGATPVLARGSGQYEPDNYIPNSGWSRTENGHGGTMRTGYHITESPETDVGTFPPLADHHNVGFDEQETVVDDDGTERPAY